MFFCVARRLLAFTGFPGNSAHLGLGLLVCISAGPTSVQAQTPRPRTATAPTESAAAIARAGDAVVTIVAYRDGTAEITSGTGVRVADGRVLTALRHLRGATRAEVFGAEGDLLANVTTLDQAEVRLDLAILPRIITPGSRITIARRSATLLQKVRLLGPRKGTVRSVAERTVSHIEPDADGRPLLRLGAPVAASAAGAPVVNGAGELIAIAVGVLPGKEEGDIAVDVAAIRELLARAPARLGFPARDGTIAAAKAPADPKAAPAPAVATPESAPSARASVFPGRYGTPPISADTAGQFAVELFGCVRFESRQKVYCYLRVTNLSQGATFTVKGGDLADSTRKKVRSAANLLIAASGTAAETTQRVAGWRTKAEVTLRELDPTRVALEFDPPAQDGDVSRLMFDIAGERTLWLGPFILRRAP
jgi:hypothetical protein